MHYNFKLKHILQAFQHGNDCSHFLPDFCDSLCNTLSSRLQNFFPAFFVLGSRHLPHVIGWQFPRFPTRITLSSVVPGLDVCDLFVSPRLLNFVLFRALNNFLSALCWSVKLFTFPTSSRETFCSLNKRSSPILVQWFQQLKAWVPLQVFNISSFQLNRGGVSSW